jgi:hypothetical protein
MSKLLIALFIAAGLSVAGPAAAQMYASKTAATPMSKDTYTMAKTNAATQYKADKEACASLSGNAKDICMAEAKGKDNVALADAEASYQNTAKHRETARVARAQANYNVAIEKCDDLAGNAKDVCVKEAKAAHVKAAADAKVDRVASEARTNANERTADAQRTAAGDKRDADYRVAVEKCDALAGSAKDACVREAKLRYGKS